MKTSDYIAQFLAGRGVRHLFVISGAGNVHLLDAIAAHPDLAYVCPHHEQAGVMASLAYRRISGRPGVMLTTSGGGASNAVTGVLDAWADSIPCLVISGQEKSAYARRESPLRMWGIQGFDIVRAVEGITKYAAMVNDPATIRYHLEKAFHLMDEGRPGPVWLDIPIDVQAAPIDPEALEGFSPEPAAPGEELRASAATVLSWMRQAKRPVLLLGHGIRLAGAVDALPALMEKFPFPVLTAWNGTDMVPTGHPRHFGREGNYGQRCANFVVQNCDLLVSIGSRLAIPQVGYDFREFARAAKIAVVDIDPAELSKFDDRPDLLRIAADAGVFIRALLEGAGAEPFAEPAEWMERCRGWRERYAPVDEAIHRPAPGCVNSYPFIRSLSRHFGPDEIVVTDMGTALTCTHQAIELSGRQRLVTSTGLGEMGFGLPGAIGACFAADRRRVVLITGDGSIMMNLQEFQTVAHHRLPIKMFLYVNDGYLTIKHTQAGLFGGGRFAGSGEASGVSCPDFARVGRAFGFSVFRISDPGETDAVIRTVLDTEGPVLCEVVTDPLQPLVPKLSFTVAEDGSMVSPPIEDLYPFLPRKRLEEEMIVGVHEKSRRIADPEEPA